MSNRTLLSLTLNAHWKRRLIYFFTMCVMKIPNENKYVGEGEAGRFVNAHNFRTISIILYNLRYFNQYILFVP